MLCIALRSSGVNVPRTESDINATITAVAVFAQGLRDLRLEAGNPSYRALAARTHFASSTLSTAASGNRLPSLQVTLAYVRACRGDEEIWHRRWVETSRSITNHEVLARNNGAAEDHGRRAQPAPPGGISKVGHGVFKVAVSTMIFGVLVRAWSAFRSSRSAPGPRRRQRAHPMRPLSGSLAALGLGRIHRVRGHRRSRARRAPRRARCAPRREASQRMPRPETKLI